MAQQTQKEIGVIIDYWLKYFRSRVSPRLKDIPENGKFIGDFIQNHCDGVWSTDNMTKAVEDSYVKSLLHLNPITITEEEKRLQAEEQKKAEHAAALDKFFDYWTEQHCPKGLFFGKGIHPENLTKISQYVVQNRAGKPLTVDLVNQAVQTLAGSLVWLSPNPADHEIRNQPPPPPRRLSEQAKLDAGIKQPKLKGHEDDGKLVSMADAAKKATELFNKQHGVPSDEAMDKVHAEQVSVTTRTGKFDHAKTADIRKSFAKRSDGSISWKRTLALRLKLAGEIERQRNRG